jgi:hypothetical protein
VGAYIDYVVGPGTPPGGVTITILDAQGAVVNRFASTDPAPAPDLSKINAAPEWVAKPAPPAASPGQHRFVWPLRYAPPPGLADGGEAGVWAPPGRYTVELAIGGRTWRQSLDVIPDPRVKATPADFQAEFALARRIEAARARVHAVLGDAGKLQTDLKARIKAAAPGRKDRLEALAARLEGLLDVPTDTARKEVGRPSPSVDGLADIGEVLDKLAQAADGADGAPTPDAIAGFAQVSAALDGAQARWNAIKQAAAAS